MFKPATLRVVRLTALALLLFALLISVSVPVFIDLVAATGPERSAHTYSNVTAAVGIALSHDLSLDCSPPLSAGSAWADYDNDGDIDLFVTNHGGANRLYQNGGDTNQDDLPDFTDQAVALGMDDPGKTSIASVFIDYDNDGDQDLYVTNLGGNTLYQNQLTESGAVSFTDVTTATGLLDDGRAITTAWGDYDQDGYLDVYLAKHFNCSPAPQDPHNDRLYHNNGDGTFSDQTGLLCPGGTAPCEIVDGLGFAPAWTDYDNDGDLDLYLVNDNINGVHQPNRLWRNDGSGCGGWCFSDVSVASKADISLNGMGLGVGDYDNDGYQDFAFSNIGPAVLLRNRGDGTFANVSVTTTISATTAPWITWGTVFFDHDNDGWLDLYYVAGEIGTGQQPNVFLANNRDGTFSDFSASTGLDQLGRGRNASTVDFDEDGYIDVFVGNFGNPPALLHNNGAVSPGAENWLQLTFQGTVSNRDAIGTRVYATAGGITQMREINSGPTHGGGDYRMAHFGLGAHSQVQLSVRWPDGTLTNYGTIPANQKMHLIEPDPAQTTTFSDVTVQAGLVTTHTIGTTCPSGPPLSTGQAFADYDDDGDIDLFVTNHGGANHLYRNDGDNDADQVPDFTDVAGALGIDDASRVSLSAVFIDYDNDGDQDLYVTHFGGNSLYQNRLVEDGVPAFQDVTAQAGLGDEGRAITTAWGDYDSDGHLDLFLAKHSYCGAADPRNHDRLFHSNGDGTFSEVTDLLCPLGSAPCFQTDGTGFSPGWADFDEDGDLDLYLVNDVLSDPISNTHNILWRNDGPDGGSGWLFTDISAASNAGLAVNGMGLGIGDYDNDGHFDIAFSDIGPGHLLDNDGSALFSDRSFASNVTGLTGGTTWGTLFFDYENDGWLDLYFVAGLIGSGGLENYLLGNNADGTFSDHSVSSGLNNAGRGRSAAMADINNDGFVDLFVGNFGESPALFLNRAPFQGTINNWLSITVEGTQSNRDGIGTVVQVTAGGVTQKRLISSGPTHGGGDYRAAYFGLGTQPSAQVEVTWPNGVVETIGLVAANQAIHLLEPAAGGATATPTPTSTDSTPTATASPTKTGTPGGPSPTPSPSSTPGPATPTPTPTPTSAVAPNPPGTYVEVSNTVGIDISHQIDASLCGPALTAGAAWADYNNDGRVDLFLPNHGGANWLFENTGDETSDDLPDFTDVAAAVGVDDPDQASLSAVFIDYDNDGDQDLFVTNWGGNNRLWQNQLNQSGSAVFIDRAPQAGLTGGMRAVTSAWADYDRDGYLDMYLVGHLPCGGFPPDPDHLFHNQGDGTFSEVSGYLCPSGLAPCAETAGSGGSAGWLDYDDDGDLDLYLVNDDRRGYGRNRLWRNDGPDGSGGWSFSEVGQAAGIGASLWSFGIGIADYNNDGQLDLAASSDATGGNPPSQLWSNNGDSSFEDQTGVSGVGPATAGRIGWGMVFFDHNNDGWQDLYLVSGSAGTPANNHPNILLLNEADGSFSDVSAVTGLHDPGRGRSAAIADINLDGFIDVLVANFGTAPKLFVNQGTSRNAATANWLVITLEGARSNRDAIGARLYLTSGGLTQVREIRSGASHASGDYRMAHFGLGAATSGELSIRWPDGTVQVIGTVSANQHLHLVEPGAVGAIYLPLVYHESSSARLARQRHALAEPLVSVTAGLPAGVNAEYEAGQQ